jgi:hypothetical protein
MSFVEPIRDRKKISQIKNLLRGQRRFPLLVVALGGEMHSGFARSVTILI